MIDTPTKIALDRECTETLGHSNSHVTWYLECGGRDKNHLADLLADRDGAAVERLTGMRPQFNTQHTWRPKLRRECEALVARCATILKGQTR